MKKQHKNGAIAFIIYLFIGASCFAFLNIFFFRGILSIFFSQLFLMILYAVIPCVPAVILRIIFGERALKWIAVAATVLFALCCIINIFLPAEILEETVVVYEDASVKIMDSVNEWIFILTQFALTSSVPALYCVAFAGDLYALPFVRKGMSVLVILAPSFMFFLSLLIRSIVGISYLEEAIDFMSEQIMITTMLASLIYAVWALLLIFISRMIYRVINAGKLKHESHNMKRNLK